VAELKGRFAVQAEQPCSAFVGRRSPDLDLIFALQLERTVNQYNTVSFQNHRCRLQRCAGGTRWRAAA
jgi:hypothetical protein